MTTNPENLAVGTLVGARRWPYHGAHPGCWTKPWSGVVLAEDDPRAWAGSIAFPSETPDPAAVREHVAWCHRQGLLSDKLPVLWDFGAHGFKVYWSVASTLRPYAEDLAAWETERAAALAEAETREQAWKAKQEEERRARAA